MNVTDFNFELPPELIAQDPLEDRSASRLLVLDKKTGEMEHRHFRDILHYLKKGDCLVINDTKVIPARLMGHKVGTDAGIEVLLLKRKSDNVWETLVKPGKKMKVGAEVSFGDGLLKGKVIDVVDEGNHHIFHVLGRVAVAPVGRAHPLQVLGTGLVQNIHARVAQGASVQSGESLAFAEQKNAGQAAVSAGHGVFLAYTKGHGATSAAVAFTLYI